MTTNTVTTTTTEISLAKLTPSPANVRRTGAGAGIEALAASIQAHGLLQSLVVRPKLNKKGQATDRYEVVAGGRRLTALKLLAKNKRIAKSTAVPCRVLDGEGVDGSEASLAENVVRVDMHPADQFEALARLQEGGTGIEDIAARFGVSAHTVRQRLRLAVVSLVLIQAYRDEVLTLDDLTAFAATEDQAAREQVFGQLLDWQRTPDTIRRLLTHALIPRPTGRCCSSGWTPTRQQAARCSVTCSARTAAAGTRMPPCWNSWWPSGWPRGAASFRPTRSTMARHGGRQAAARDRSSRPSTIRLRRSMGGLAITYG